MTGGDDGRGQRIPPAGFWAKVRADLRAVWGWVVASPLVWLVGVVLAVVGVSRVRLANLERRRIRAQSEADRAARALAVQRTREASARAERRAVQAADRAAAAGDEVEKASDRAKSGARQANDIARKYKGKRRGK